MEYSSEQEKVIDDGEDEGWVDTHHFSEKSSVEEKVSEMKLDEDEDGPTATDPDSDEEAVDMEAFAESGMLEDAATVDVASKKTKSAGGHSKPLSHFFDLIFFKLFFRPFHTSSEHFIEIVFSFVYANIGL